jgi:hypothetical protein
MGMPMMSKVWSLNTDISVFLGTSSDYVLSISIEYLVPHEIH